MGCVLAFFVRARYPVAFKMDLPQEFCKAMEELLGRQWGDFLQGFQAPAFKGNSVLYKYIEKNCQRLLDHNHCL